MKIIRKNQAKLFRNSKECDAFEYDLGCTGLGGVVVEVRGRHPEKGRVVNLECEELAYILEGEGKILINEAEQEFMKGDMILIERGDKYFWDGNFSVLLASAPAWNAGQCKMVD